VLSHLRPPSVRCIWWRPLANCYKVQAWRRSRWLRTLLEKVIHAQSRISQNFCSAEFDLPLPSPSFSLSSLSLPFPFPSLPLPSPLLPQINLGGLGSAESSPSGGRKRIFTHLRLSKRISWQHLSIVYVQSSRYVFVDLSREKIPTFRGDGG